MPVENLLLEPVPHHEIALSPAEFPAQFGLEGREDELLRWVLNPTPRRPEHLADQALGATRRHHDGKLADLASKQTL
jgi:hypothetical protein